MVARRSRIFSLYHRPLTVLQPEELQKDSDMVQRNKTIRHVLKIFLITLPRKKKTYVTSQYLAFRRRFQRTECPSTDEATANEKTLVEFESCWNNTNMILSMVPGKDALSRFNDHVQQKYGITVTSTAIIDSMKKDEITMEMESIIESLSEFAAKRPGLMKD